jgi:hypothetical protein
MMLTVDGSVVELAQVNRVSVRTMERRLRTMDDAGHLTTRRRGRRPALRTFTMDPQR